MTDGIKGSYVLIPWHTDPRPHGDPTSTRFCVGGEAHRRVHKHRGIRDGRSVRGILLKAVWDPSKRIACVSLPSEIRLPGSSMPSRPCAVALLLMLQLARVAGRMPVLRLRGGSTDSPWLTRGKPVLTLEAADVMANAAVDEARGSGFKDIAVFVVDASGRTIVSKTMLGCPSLPAKLAHAKAMGAVTTHSSSRALKEKYVPERTPQLIAMTVVGTACQLPLAAVPGGVLCRDSSGNVVGAVGVSGASADEDEHCALVAAQAVGLVTEPRESKLATRAVD